MRSPRPARPVNVFARAAQRDAEARHLHQPARQQRGLGIIAQAKAIIDAGGDADDVLERPSQLDADRIAIRVDAKILGAENAVGRYEPVRHPDWRRRPTRAVLGSSPPRDWDH